ncbi:MAG TPA: hypothetical protein VF743_08540 [Acidimicrobiales bacterium]
MGLRDLHTTWSWVVILSNAAAGLWALGAHARAALRTPALWWFTAAAQLSVFVEVTLGVVLLNREGIEAPQFHMLYGFSAIVAVGIVYSYRQQLKDRQYLLYGLGGLFIMGLGIRAAFIGGGR